MMFAEDHPDMPHSPLADSLRVRPCHLLAGGALWAAELAAATTRALADPAENAWLLRAACREAQAWPAALRVIVTLPPMSVRAGTLLAQTAAALRQSGLAAGRLLIALAESDLAGSGPDLLLLVAALRDLGAGVAIDTRQACLPAVRTLQRLPLTTLRLHPQLVQNMADHADARALAGHMIRAARGLGAATVALGVDTALQRDILTDLHCDAAQSALMANQLSATGFRAALAAPLA